MSINSIPPIGDHSSYEKDFSDWKPVYQKASTGPALNEQKVPFTKFKITVPKNAAGKLIESATKNELITLLNISFNPSERIDSILEKLSYGELQKLTKMKNFNFEISKIIEENKEFSKRQLKLFQFLKQQSVSK